MNIEEEIKKDDTRTVYEEANAVPRRMAPRPKRIPNREIEYLLLHRMLKIINSTKGIEKKVAKLKEIHRTIVRLP